jgi:lysophospholipase L1-like esterase
MVIDCGISATHIENIVERIDSQLETYKPDIVISMMGINDAEFQNAEIYKKHKLKILELFMLIKKHIEQIAADQLYADDKDIDYSKLQDEYSANRKELTQLEQLIDKNPKNLKAIETISILYRMRKDYVNVEKYVGIYRANSAAPNMHMLFMLTDAYIRMGKDNDAQKLILSVLNDNDISDEDKNIYLSKAVES